MLLTQFSCEGNWRSKSIDNVLNATQLIIKETGLVLPKFKGPALDHLPASNLRLSRLGHWVNRAGDICLGTMLLKLPAVGASSFPILFPINKCVCYTGPVRISCHKWLASKFVTSRLVQIRATDPSLGCHGKVEIALPVSKAPCHPLFLSPCGLVASYSQIGSTSWATPSNSGAGHGSCTKARPPAGPLTT